MTWAGRFRPALDDQYVSPPIREAHIPTWVGAGGSTDSVLRAARRRLPLMLAVIGGRPERFAPYVQLYERALAEAADPPLPSGCVRWVRRAHGRGGRGDPVALLRGAVRVVRPGARPAPADLRAVSRRDRARFAVRRVARDGGGTDRRRDADPFNGAQYGVAAASLRRPRVVYGLPFGAAVWAGGYVVLPAAHLNEPISAYDRVTLAKDLSAHLVYGLATAAGPRLLTR